MSSLATAATAAADKCEVEIRVNSYVVDREVYSSHKACGETLPSLL